MNKFNANFYDIESLQQVFTLANFKERQNHIDLYLLCDNPQLLITPVGQTFYNLVLDRIYQRNHNFNGTLTIYDLSTEAGVRHLATTFGLSDSPLINDPAEPSHYPSEFRMVCDTDKEYDEEIHPYFIGYNSTNYDMTMLAQFLYECFNVFDVPVEDENGQAYVDHRIRFTPQTASYMRTVNDHLFEPKYKDNMPIYLTIPEGDFYQTQPNYSDPRWRIRKNMLLTGRYIDASVLNEKQKKVALKRQLGMSGYQILESDKLKPTDNSIDTLDQLLEVIAYNVSDIVNLAEQFGQKLYQGQFTLKRQLLKTYPELVYKKQKDSYKPDERPSMVRKDRCLIDSTSSRLAQLTLCPYGHLKDIQTVSFYYPHPDKAKELGIPTVNVLDEAKEFFYNLYPQPEIRARFDEIYNYYKQIEGKNFNESTQYLEDWGDKAVPASKINDIPKCINCIPYFDHDGKPTSGFATFSTGGVHGAEYNQRLYEFDHAVWAEFKRKMDYVQSLYPDGAKLHEECGKKKSKFILSTGMEVTRQRLANAVKSLQQMDAADITALLNKTTKKTEKETLIVHIVQNNLNIDDLDNMVNRPVGVPAPNGEFWPTSWFLKTDKATYKDIDRLEPQVFLMGKKGSYELNKKYVYTSCDIANHEDFTSYYPNLLRMMKAFYNPGLGDDRYAEIFQQKQDYGKIMKDKSRPASEREYYSILREGTKLILNSASGAGDATFDNNIRMNNNIISMRIIGQLFSWRIGQAQAYQGAKITSTNTDGLYSVLEETLNNKILEKEAKDIGVEIEPEPLFLISKDTNNRLELNTKADKITAASGGDLACRQGPNPTKSLAHPAIIDWALSEYLTICAQNYKGLSLDQPFNKTIGMNILKSAIYKHDPITWLRLFQNIIASSPGSIRYIYGARENEPPIILQHYNRVFYMTHATAQTMNLWCASARVIQEDSKKNRIKEKQPPRILEGIASQVLKKNGVIPPNDKDIVTSKVASIDPEWNVLVENRDLRNLSIHEFHELVANINYENYLSIVADKYEENWRNHLPNVAYVQLMDKENHLATITYDHGQMLNKQAIDKVVQDLPTPVQTWNTLPDGTGEVVDFNNPCFENTTIYAMY